MSTINYYTITDQVKQYVQSLFHGPESKKLVYHSIEHTRRVVTAATQIANHYQLNDRDFFVVITAAWFHDIGYLTGANLHEEKGAESAARFLRERGVEEDSITAVQGCILSTRLPQSPKNLLEQIVCDADLFHLGTQDFARFNKLLRKEMELLYNKKINKQEWRSKAIVLLQLHHYQTDYCRLLLDETKQQNLQKLKEKEAAATSPVATGVQTTAPAVAQPVADTEKTEKADKAANREKKKDRPERGIETMFRITSANHQRLSDMADSKAHIMISTNSIIISVLLSVLLRKLEEYPRFTIPSFMLLVTCVVAMVFSILATRPNIPHGTFTKKDIDDKSVNLLFFGNFYKMSLNDYTEGMLQMMNERDFLYGSLIRDLYSQGVVLGRKYSLLRVGYNVFMFGIIISVLAFIIASLAY